MEWIAFELQPEPGKEHFSHQQPGYNPNAFAPGQETQVYAEKMMRYYGHKPWYPPFNQQDAQRRQKILKRQREYGFSDRYEGADAEESVQHIDHINSLRPKHPGYYHNLLDPHFKN